jgi:hypothetical protein
MAAMESIQKKSSEQPQHTKSTQRNKNNGKIHPIIMYPFSHPKDMIHIRALYEKLVRDLDQKAKDENSKYMRPITVMNRQTYYNNAQWTFDIEHNQCFKDFYENEVKVHSEIIDAWAVDTCQMWLTGFGAAYDQINPGDDVYWLIPGDFDYASKAGKEVLEKIYEIPQAILENDQDICLGEIKVDINSSKQLIDTYGTYGLLYNWFPREAQEIRAKTDKPRTEFFAISHAFLREILRQRWFAYEQTIVILLQAIIGRKRIHRIELGQVTDLPQGRDTLAAAMQQVERTERVLKLFWRELNHKQADWSERFKKLDQQSGQIRGAALVILENLLVYP